MSETIVPVEEITDPEVRGLVEQGLVIVVAHDGELFARLTEAGMNAAEELANNVGTEKEQQ